MDYYSILGVNKQATADEIKKAYKSKAMEHHPDLGGDHNTFAQINEAYETLKNPQKRAEYDTPKPSFNFRQTTNNPRGFEDVFEQFFGGRQRQQKNRDLKLQVVIDLKEAAIGKDFIAHYTLLNGQETSANIRIHPGVHHGEVIRFKGLGDNSFHQFQRGDLLVLVQVKNHPRFVRDGANLYVDVNIDVFELMIGTVIIIEKLTGGPLRVNIPKGTQPGTTLSLAGYGMPDYKRGKTGNLYVKIKGKIPNIKNDALLKKVKELNDEINNST